MQISLDAKLRRQVAVRAASAGISIAEYVRRAIANDLDKPAKTYDIAKLFDLGRSDNSTDVGRDKDRMLAEAIRPGHK